MTNTIESTLEKVKSYPLKDAEIVLLINRINHTDTNTLKSIFNVYNMIYCDDFNDFDQTHAETFEQYFA